MSDFVGSSLTRRLPTISGVSSYGLTPKECEARILGNVTYHHQFSLAIIALAERGYPPDYFSTYTKIPVATLIKWKHDNVEFSASWDMALQTNRDYWIDKMLAVISDDSIEYQEKSLRLKCVQNIQTLYGHFSKTAGVELDETKRQIAKANASAQRVSDPTKDSVTLDSLDDDLGF